MARGWLGVLRAWCERRREIHKRLGEDLGNGHWWLYGGVSERSVRGSMSICEGDGGMESVRAELGWMRRFLDKWRVGTYNCCPGAAV